VTPETRGWINAEAFAAMKDGVRFINCARGELVDDAALKDALDSGKVAGAALDVFPSEPITDYPLFDGYENVVVTPHLGASTTEAQDRAGTQTAEQIIAALTPGGVVTTAVNIPAISPADMEVLGPFVPLCRQLGRLAVSLAEGSSIDRLEVEYLGRIGERDTRLLSVAVLMGVLAGHVEEDVNAVNAPGLAEERGIEVSETKRTTARDFTDLVRVTIVSGDSHTRVVGTTLGRRNRPHLLEAWGQRFNLQLEDNVALFRYRDVPGMIGRVGSAFGEHGLNIVSAAVGRQPDEDREDGAEDGANAVMAVTSDAPISQAVVDAIVAGDGFVAGRAVTL
jgi:D-3-phosphoglycerate dehydrogenase / 2-oxoglutarate reductase